MHYRSFDDDHDTDVVSEPDTKLDIKLEKAETFTIEENVTGIIIKIKNIDPALRDGYAHVERFAQFVQKKFPNLNIVCVAGADFDVYKIIGEKGGKAEKIVPPNSRLLELD